MYTKKASYYWFGVKINLQNLGVREKLEGYR